MTRFKPFEELTFADNYMFTRVMQDLDICKELLEILLKIKIEEIRVPESEASLAASYDAKSIRLDVRTSDPVREYDIEMQTTDEHDLPLRARYYQSLMDIEATQRGTMYKGLKENIVIFICLFDPFGAGEPVYTIRNKCDENSAVKYDDRVRKIFYNCKNCDKMEDRETRDFLRYVATKRAASGYTRQLEERVRSYRMTPREQLYYNNWLEITGKIRDEAKEEGFAEGKTEGAHENAIATARNFLRMGLVPEQIADGTGLSLEEVQSLQAANA